MTSFLDTHALAAYIKTKQGERGLREIAQEIGETSPATLSRLENGTTPDIPTFLRVCDWLGVQTGEFIKDTAMSTEQTTLERIEATLRSDPLLDPEQAEALTTFLRMAYALMTPRAEDR